MKPAYQQDWTYRINNNGPTVYRGAEDSVCMVYYPRVERMTLAEGDERAIEAARLIATAPKLARELLHLVRLLEPLEKEGGLDVPGLATLSGARVALRDAGVIE